MPTQVLERSNYRRWYYENVTKKDPEKYARHLERARQYRKEHPDKHKAATQRCWERLGKEHRYGLQLKRAYGMTSADYEKMLNSQSGCCAICGIPAGKIKRGGGRLVVDHDHETGKVRGLLCHKCNRGIGQFNDDITLLDSAKRYLAV